MWHKAEWMGRPQILSKLVSITIIMQISEHHKGYAN